MTAQLNQASNRYLKLVTSSLLTDFVISGQRQKSYVETLEVCDKDI